MPKRFIILLPPLLLVAVALNQLRLSATESLSPWSGGGFGMFASTDSPGSRHLHVYVHNAGVRKEIAFPASLQTQVLRATTLPSRYRLEQLARAVAVAESGSSFSWDEIVVEVWANDYQPDTLMPLAGLLREERFVFSSF